MANGPFLPKEIILEAATDKHIIALDGAADCLAALGIMPEVILGDLESIQNGDDWGITQTFDDIPEDAKPYLGRHGIEIFPDKNQNLTDLQKAIYFCDRRQARSIHIVCATGARIDHTLYNIRMLRAAYKAERPIFLHTEMQTLQYVKNGHCTIRGKIGDHCGIMAFPSARFTSQGLQYNGTYFPLTFAFSESVCNRLSAESAEIEIEGEALLIMPGIFPTQHK